MLIMNMDEMLTSQEPDAKKVPDGHITMHANQARITTFDKNSPDVLYSEDVMLFLLQEK